MVDGFGSEVLPHPYHMPAIADAAAQWASGGRVECARGFAQLFPPRPQGFKASLEADAFLEHLAGYGRVAGFERIEDAEIERIDAELDRELVEKLLLRDRALRHAKPAKGAGRDEMGVDRPRARAVIRHAVWARRVNRHPIGDGRPPRRISAGIEIGGKIHGREATVAALRRSWRE